MTKNNFFSKSIKQLLAVVFLFIATVVNGQWTQTSQANIYSPVSGTLSLLGDFGYGTDNNGVEYMVYTEFISGSNSTWDLARVKKLNPTTKEWENFGPTYATTIPGRHPRIAFDANNDLYIAYIDLPSGNGNNKVIIRKFNAGNQTWQNAFGTSESPVVGVAGVSLSNQNNIMDLDFEGLNPLVAMQTTSTAFNVYLHDGSSWSNSLTNNSNYNGARFDLAKNGSRVYLFYPNSSNNIQGVYFESNMWNSLAGTGTFTGTFIPRIITKFHNSDIYIGISSISGTNNLYAKLFKYSANTYTDISSPLFGTPGSSFDAFHFDLTPQGEPLVAYCSKTSTPAFGISALLYSSNSWTSVGCPNFAIGANSNNNGSLVNSMTLNIKALSNNEYFVNTRTNTTTVGRAFVYNPPAAPTISSFSPASGPIGSTVTITGTNFLCASAVSFNGTAATSFTVNSATSITATVPSGATTGAIAVTTAGGTATSSSNYTVAGQIIAEYPFNNSLAPIIGSFGNATHGVGHATFGGGGTDICTDGSPSGSNSLIIPSITSLDLTSFQVDVDLKVTTTPAANGAVAFMLSGGSRALGLRVNTNGTFFVQYTLSTGTSVSTQSTTATLTLNTNHSISVQLVNNSIRVTLDGVLVLVHGMQTNLSSVASSDRNFYLGDHPAGSSLLQACYDNFRIINNPAQFSNSTVITATPNLITGLNAVSGAPSTAQTFSIAGTGLSGDILITAPSFYEVSSNGTVFSNTLTLPQSSGTVTATTVYVRMTNHTTINSYTGSNARILSLTEVGGIFGTTMRLEGVKSAAPPTITSFTPTSGAIGSTVTFTGTNLTGATAVSFNGTAATTFSATNATTLTATVPSGATTGTIAVTTPGGTATSATSFTVVPAPTITSFTPSSGSIGATVTLTGTNFTGATVVSFNGTAATTFTATSATQITATIPVGATTGTIAVTTPGGTVTSATALSIVVPPPTITSFTPTSAEVGNAITITGTGFSSTPANNIVYFGSVKAIVTAATSTSLTVTVPKSSVYAPITVVSNNLLVKSNDFFRVINIPIAPNTITNDKFGNNVAISSTPGYHFNFKDMYIAVGDFDNDGKIDVVKGGSDQVRVHRNLMTSPSTISSSSFSAGNNFSVSGRPRSMIVEDINSDGKLDIITGSNTGVSILINNSTGIGSISFAPAVNIANSYADVVRAADFDLDGKLDLVTIRSTSVAIYRNISISGFTLDVAQIVNIPTLTGCQGLGVGDFNKDSKPDIVVSNSSSTAILLNSSSNGSISFPNNLSLSGGGSSVTIGDFDNDFDPDIYLTNRIFINNYSSGNISSSNFSSFTYNLDGGASAYSISDFNGDGKLEINGGSTWDACYTMIINTLPISNSSLSSIGYFLSKTYGYTAGPGLGVDVDGDDKVDYISAANYADIFSVTQNLMTPPPVISASGSLSAFTKCPGVASTAQTFTVSGNYLTGNIAINAVSGYEYSLDGTTYSSTLSISPVSQSVAATTVYVRLSAASTGSPAGNISISSTNATTQTVAVTGTVLTNQNFGNALALNGTGKIQFGNQTAAAVSTNFTIEAWVNVPSSAWSLQTVLSNSPTPSSLPGFKFAVNNWQTNDGKIVLEGSNTFLSSATAVTKDVWQHVAVVVNGTNVTFYINGNISGSYTGSFNATSAYPLTIGDFSGGSYPFNGTMDELRLWNVSKSQQDIQAAMYTPLVGNESGLAAYFNFNQGTPGGTNTGITNLLDNGPNAFTGSLSEITRTGTAENFVLNTNTMGITGSLACVGSTVQLNHPQSGGTWTSATTSVATVSSTGLVTCLTAGSSVITYAYTYNGCQFTNTYTVTVNATPTTPTVANTTISYCQNGSATALSATAAASHSLRWYTVATGGTGSATAITPVTSTAGTFTYYVSQANASGCEGPRVAITVTVSPVSVAGTASVNLASVCGGSTVDLSLTGNTGTIQWQSSPNNSTWTNISGATAATYTTTALNATTYFRAVVTSGACSVANSNVLTVTVTTIAVPTTTTSITECQGNTATQLSATALSGHTLQWYTVSTGGTASSTAITPDLSNAAVTTYYVSQLNNTSNCESARVPIVVTVYALPAAPTTTTTINYCKGATPSALTATATSGLNLQWYTTATGGTASTTAPTPSTSTVGTTTYYVSQKANAGSYSLATGNNGTLSSMVQNLGQTFQVANNIVLNTINFDIIFFYSPAPVTLKIYNGFGGALIATANSVFNPGYYHNYNVPFSFSGQNLQLNAGQTYYMELTSSQNMYVWLNSNVLASGVTYSNSAAQAGNDFGFTLAGTLNVNPCESPRTAITVNVNDLPTISGVQNMTVGGSTLQLTGSGTPNANSPWTSSNTSTATISATGEVTAVAGGSTIITYTNVDGCSISQSITVVDCSQPLGNVLHFDGVNDYITTASNIPALNITADLTLETWIKFDQGHSDFVRLIGKGDVNNRTYGLWLQTDGKLLFQINGTPTGLNFTSTTSLQPGIWYHIAAIRNGNTAKIFINGVEDATATTTVSPQTNTFPLIVGYGTIHNYLKGSLEDVRVWNIARTVSQIQQGMYNSFDGNETGLVAYYDFNQGIASGNNTTITTANDKSLNALNATLTNFGKTGGTSNFIGNTIVNFAVSGASIVCANSTSQFTHPRSGGTWSISNGASASINSSGLLTTLANENVTVSYTYTINGCSVTDSKSVSINTPAAPVVTTPVNLCQGVTATALTATPVSGSNLLWYTAATGGTASSTAPTPTTTTVGSTTYYVSQKAPSGPYIIDNLYNYNYANNISTFGQTFTPANNIILNSITLKTAYINTNTPNIVLKIYNGYGGALLATANSPFTSSYGYTWFNDLGFSFSGQNLVLTSGQTYYLEFVPNSTMYPGYSNAYANGTGYINGGVISQDFAFKLDASINSNPCESPRTAITVNVNALPTISGVQNMTVGGSTLQLTGSGTPDATTPWASSNTAVATISATGEVTAVADGTSVITYTTASGCSITTTVKVTDCASPFGNALNFDGVNDYAVVDNVGNNSNLSFSGTSNFTIESWVKRENTNGIAMIFSKYNGGVAGNYWLGIDNTGKPIFSREASPWGVTATNTLPVNEWHHIAATYDGSQTKIYVDGVLNNTTSAPLSINQNVSAIKVNIGAGLANNNPNYLFKGELDEIRVWNVARTATQIQQTYNTTLQGNETGLVAYYDFNQGIAGGNNASINTVINAVNSASNGALTNFNKFGNSSNFVGSTIANFPINGPASICAYSSAQFTHQISGGTWSLASGAAATISNTGLITSSANETVTINYTYSMNGCSVTVTKTVTIENPVISGLATVAAGEQITLTATTTPATNNAWVSTNTSKLSVTSAGVVTGLAPGTASVIYTNNLGCKDTLAVTVTVGTTLAPTLTSPATNTTGATTLNIVYSLPEAPLAGSVTLTFTPVGGGTPIVWTMNNATSANFNYVVGTNPVSSNVTAGAALGFTTYNVTLAYQDAYANPAATVTNTNIQTLAPPLISFVSSSYATVVNSTLTINTINTGGSMVTYSISPALPSGFTFNTTTGVITGSSTVAFNAINFTVTATNAAGTSTATVSIAITADTDGDGIPDIADADVNGDGVIDNGPDTDGDGIIDLYDNDIDGDGIPNNLDNDADGDGVPNSQDVCAFIPNTAITVQPSTTNQVICPSATISPLTVTATGPGLSYQWYRNTTATTTGGTLLTGATSASYSPLNTVVGTVYYYVVVTGTCGTATSNVSGSILVTDITLPTVVTQNRTIYLNASGQATITAAQIDNGSTDNCAIATRTLNQTAFNCNNVGANTVTLTVTDVSGNIRTGNATVTVVDSIKPTVVTQNITVNLNASGQASITAAQINNGSSDNCGIASVTLNQTAFTCANTGANTVTLTVIDVNGNVKTKTATVTVVDNILPTVVTQNVIRYLNASGQATVTANDINNGSTDNCGIGTVALSQTAFTCAHVGVNTVTLSVTDTKGNTATGQATVTIIDNTPPTAIAQNINAYLNAGGAVTVTPSQVGGNSTDNCSIATMTLNNTTFNCNNLGANPVILTVVDPFNNVSTANAVITVVDSIKPLLTIPADITVNTNSGCGAFGFPIGTASATDNCSVISAITNNAPTFYPVGITNIVYSVTDGSGNTKTKIQKVTVIDNVIPIITAPVSITTTLTAGCTKTGLNLGTPVTSDNCTIASVTNNAPTAFPVGTTTVTWTVTDASGNTATATQTVTVTDAINPTITAPANLTINANASCVAFGVNLGTPVIADNCTVASVSNNAPAVFPLGTTIVTWTVNDASGNSASTNQQVTVVDNTAPMIFAPAAITTAITSGCTLSSIALGTPITLDNCSVATISNNAPTTFPIGATTVTWTVTDAAGNSNTATQVVTIVDNTNPTIVAPASVTANLTTGCTTTGIVLGTPITADNCTVANVTNNAPATYSLGTTIVTWTVTDGAGNTATATQLVTISDNTNPTITAPAAIAINTTTGCTVTGLALGTPVTADNCTVASVTNNAPTSFPIGSTSVIWTVTDGSGNTATATQVVTVSDVTNPTITAPVAITVTTNSGCEASGIALGLPITADNCTVASVTNNAPATFPIGTTTVTWTVTDAAGNTSTATQTVTVIDNINPSIIAPSAVTFYVSSGCSVNGIVIGTPVTADNCTVASVTNNAPATFPIGSTTVTWTVTDGAGNSAVATQVIQVIDTIAPTALVNDVTIALGLNGTATVSSAMVDAGSFDNCGLESFVLSQSMFSCNDLGTNVVQVTITDSYGNSAIAFVKVTITPSGIDVDMDGIDDACDEFVNTQIVQVPSGFSPNGDNINDTFIIPALDQFTKVQLQVYNKYGHEVYVSSLYKNDWDGTSSFNGLELPDDTYFYILNTDGELRQGYVYINRIK